MAFTKQIGSIIASLRPGETHTVIGHENLYSNMTWTDVTATPTEQELLDHEIVMAKAERTTLTKIEARKRILAAVPQWRQNNKNAGEYDQSTTDSLNATINTIRADSNTAESAIDALTTAQACIDFTW